MPYKWQLEKGKLPRDKDRRVKLTDDQREELRNLKGVLSQRKAAAKFGVSRRLVTFVWFPERYEVCRKQFIERRREGRYKPTKKEWAETMREHRRYKQKVMKEVYDGDKALPK